MPRAETAGQGLTGHTPAASAPPGDAPGEDDPAFRFLAYGLVLILTVQLAVWGAFLVPFRIGATIVPVCWLVAVVGNAAVGYAGGRIAGKLGAAFPGLLWLLVTFPLGMKRTEGDLVVTGTLTGSVFLVLGALASATAYGVVLARSLRTGSPPA